MITEIDKQIAEFIFSENDKLKIADKELDKLTFNGLRRVYYNGYLYIEQNPNKQSNYAKLAREGKKIVWKIPKNNTNWEMIMVN
jgi:hypothetical protein